MRGKQKPTSGNTRNCYCSAKLIKTGSELAQQNPKLKPKLARNFRMLLLSIVPI